MIAERAAAAQKAKLQQVRTPHGQHAFAIYLHGTVLILLHNHRRLVLLPLVQHRTTSISLRLPHVQHLPQNHPQEVITRVYLTWLLLNQSISQKKPAKSV